MNDKIPTSPVTGSTNTQLISRYNCSISSDCRLLEAGVENRLCLDSGLVFNASGARGNESSFYMDEYDLHSESAISEFIYFDQDGEVGIYDNILKFVVDNLNLPSRGRVLDIGCGKGLLLKKFSRLFPEWELCAVEPSKNAGAFFSEVMPELNVFNGNFEDSPYINQSFDLVLSNGVLEHVPAPLEFLSSIKGCLSEKGRVYIGVPNFANNPADLFTFDHLSRFSPDTLNSIFGMAGFKVFESLVLPTRVPMWYLLESMEAKELKENSQVVEQSKLLVEQHLTDVERFFSSYQQCMDERKENERIGMYGTGAFGFLGTQHTSLSTDALAMIYDDNHTLWGSYKLDTQISDPKNIVSDGIDKLIISANPCYLDSIVGKVKSIIQGTNIKLYIP